MLLKKAMKSNMPGIEEAITKELQQLIDKPVWEYLHKRNIPKADRRKIIRSHLFMKDKYKSDGAFEKWKARLVAGGDTQDKSIYDDLSSPTVCLDSVFTIIAIAACEGRKICTIDITGAYLECLLPPGDDVYMVLDPVVTKILAKLDPNAAQHITTSGEVLVKLTRALYGCVQSALLWFNKLKDTLERAGFVANAYDMCVFNKMHKGKQITVAFHVDDLLVTSESDDAISHLIADLESKFTAVTAERGDKHSYLAMTIEIKKAYYTVSMDGYISTLTAGRKIREVASPANDKLFEEEQDPVPLSNTDKKSFHSDVAKLLFLAKRVKMPCLTAVSSLASRVAAPTQEDMRKLDRVFSYVATSKGQIMKFKVRGNINPVAFVDASYATQPGGKSRTGILLKIAGCAIAVWSVKQKIVTRSSTEAELVALTEALTNIVWIRRFYEHQGYRDLPPTVIWEDNMSCIDLITLPRHNRQRTKHLDIRYFYAKELSEQGAIEVRFVPTEHQQADLLTKGMVGSFSTLACRMTGNEHSIYG
jgi:ribonuclease HI